MHEWSPKAIRELISGEWPGEWGSEAGVDGTDVVVYRSTELDDEGHVQQGGVHRSIPRKKLETKRLSAGDILLEASGGTPGRPVGRVGLYQPVHPEVAICSNFLRTLRPRDGVCSSFLRWALVNLHRQPEIWRFHQQTTGISNLNVRDYLRHNLHIPPLKDQERISEILTTLDDALKQAESLIAKTRKVKAGLMQDLFARGVTPDGQLRPPLEEAPELYQESRVGSIPREWTVEEFGTFLLGGPQNGLYKPIDYYSPAGVPIVRIDSFDDGEIRGPEYLKRLQVGEEEGRIYGLAASDILINRVNSIDYVGKAAIVREPSEPMVFESNIMRCRIGGCRLLPDFAIRWCRSPQARRHLRSRAKSAISQASINQRDVRCLPVPIPSREEQERICERADSVSELEVQAQQELQKLSHLRRGLVHDLLTGKVRVSSPSELERQAV